MGEQKHRPNAIMFSYPGQHLSVDASVWRYSAFLPDANFNGMARGVDLDWNATIKYHCSPSLVFGERRRRHWQSRLDVNPKASRFIKFKFIFLIPFFEVWPWLQRPYC